MNCFNRNDLFNHYFVMRMEDLSVYVSRKLNPKRYGMEPLDVVHQCWCQLAYSQTMKDGALKEITDIDRYVFKACVNKSRQIIFDEARKEKTKKRNEHLVRLTEHVYPKTDVRDIQDSLNDTEIVIVKNRDMNTLDLCSDLSITKHVYYDTLKQMRKRLRRELL